MSKKSITDFFKPFAFPRQNKRPLSTDESEETRPSQTSRSTTPKSTKHTNPEPAKASVKQNDALLISSQSSVLSSVQNSTPRGLDDPPSQDHALPLRDFGDDHSVQSNPSNRLDHQAPIFNSSQRIVRNGEVIIKDSDDERSDSDISLEDLEDLIAPRERPPAPSHPPGSENRTPLSPAKTRSKTGRSTRKGHRDSAPVAADSTPSTSTALPRYKFSLDALIKQSKNDHDSKEKINKAKHLLEDLEEQRPISQGIDDVLAAVVGGQDEDDPTGKHDLKGAMERTEALYQDRIWSFFDIKQIVEDNEPMDCPPIADSYWRDLLEEPATRQQAILSGYLGECASLRKLPHELLVWLLDSACYERRGDLQNSYCQTLRACGDQLTSCLTISTFDKVFQRIGARSEALDFEIAVVPRLGLQEPLQFDAHATLRRLLDVYLNVAGIMSPKLKTHTLCVLSRLLLDRSVANDCRLVYTIEAIISTILETMEDENNTDLSNAIKAVYSSVGDPGLQLQLLQHLPSTSFAQSLLRRRLALAFLFHDQTFLTKEPQPLLDLKTVISHLDKPQFALNHTTDYASLAALIGILVIGLDNADPPPNDGGRDATIAFNADVDKLAERVHKLWSLINDNKAAHRERTEAKEVLRWFETCLKAGIRTEEKPKGMILDDDTVLEKQRSIMKGFFRRDKAVGNIDGVA